MKNSSKCKISDTDLLLLKSMADEDGIISNLSSKNRALFERITDKYNHNKIAIVKDVKNNCGKLLYFRTFNEIDMYAQIMKHRRYVKNGVFDKAQLINRFADKEEELNKLSQYIR